VNLQFVEQPHLLRARATEVLELIAKIAHYCKMAKNLESKVSI
jgi:hypothetical protein